MSLAPATEFEASTVVYAAPFSSHFAGPNFFGSNSSVANARRKNSFVSAFFCPDAVWVTKVTASTRTNHSIVRSLTLPRTQRRLKLIPSPIHRVQYPAQCCITISSFLTHLCTSVANTALYSLRAPRYNSCWRIWTPPVRGKGFSHLGFLLWHRKPSFGPRCGHWAKRKEVACRPNPKQHASISSSTKNKPNPF